MPESIDSARKQGWVPLKSPNQATQVGCPEGSPGQCWRLALDPGKARKKKGQPRRGPGMQRLERPCEREDGGDRARTMVTAT